MHACMKGSVASQMHASACSSLLPGHTHAPKCTHLEGRSEAATSHAAASHAQVWRHAQRVSTDLVREVAGPGGSFLP